MSVDLLLIVAGVLIFAITTVATLWFGYSRFFEWYEQSPDAAGSTTSATAGAAPAPSPVAPAPVGAAVL